MTALGARSVIASIADSADRFDVVLESVGGASLEQAVARVRPDGRIISFGNSSGTKAALDLFAFFGAENASVETFFSSRAFDHAAIGRDLRALLDLVDRGRLVIRATIHGWHEVEGALNGLEGRGTPGKIVLTIG